MSIAILILMLLAVVGGGTMVAILGWIMSRMKQLESRPGDRSELGIISQQMDALRDQLFVVEDEMAKLNERVDFTEKLLEAPRAQPELAEPSDLP
jgi:outer membrane murein-binding lipoprotein Lpp